MKKIILGLFLVASATATLSSCKDADKIPAPEKEDLPLIFPRATPGKDSIYIVNARYSLNTLADSAREFPQGGFIRPVIEFTINPTDRDINIRTVEVYKSYGRDAGGGTYTYTPRVKLVDVYEFPKTLSYNSDELLRDLTFRGETQFFPVLPLLSDGSINPGQTYNNFTGTSAILITFEYILEDGRRITLTPLDRNGVVTGTFTNPPYALRIATKTTRTK